MNDLVCAMKGLVSLDITDYENLPAEKPQTTCDQLRLLLEQTSPVVGSFRLNLEPYLERWTKGGMENLFSTFRILSESAPNATVIFSGGGLLDNRALDTNLGGYRPGVIVLNLNDDFESFGEYLGEFFAARRSVLLLCKNTRDIWSAIGIAEENKFPEGQWGFQIGQMSRPEFMRVLNLNPHIPSLLPRDMWENCSLRKLIRNRYLSAEMAVENLIFDLGPIAYDFSSAAEQTDVTKTYEGMAVICGGKARAARRVISEDVSRCRTEYLFYKERSNSTV